MPEATTPTATTGTVTGGKPTEVIVKGKTVGPNKRDADEIKRREEGEKRVAENAAKQQEAEQEFFDEAIENLKKYFNENTVSNRRRDDFITRLSRELRKAKTVAAASKVRGPAVVEEPAEDGPGVQTKPLAAMVAGEKPRAGESHPTANPNPQKANKKEGKK